MKIVIIAIIVLIIILTILAISYRRKHTNQIKKLEHRKLQIQHKPIFEEMTKIKQLNMTGETEEKFETWRATWTEVIDVRMPELDNLLFDAEEYIDRFSFKKLKETVMLIEEKIQFSQQKMTEILSGLDELVGSEEKNRVEMELLQERHRSARKKILAHQPAFGETVNPLEKELETFRPKFAEYETLTENGNYLQAREIVIALTEKGDYLFQIIEQIPALLADIQNSIPTSIRELRNGVREMEEQAYNLQHLEIEKILVDIEEKLERMAEEIAQLEMDGIPEEVEEIHSQLDGLYDALEKEVVAKHYVEENYQTVYDELLRVTGLVNETLTEITFVQQSYRINEDEAKIPQSASEEIELLNKQFAVIVEQIENNTSAYSSMQETIQMITEKVGYIDEERKDFAERLKKLRNDENKVRAELKGLSKELQDADRSLHRGNIPGIPDDIDARLEEAEEQLYIVRQSLEEVPLNMTLVNSYLENAKQSVQEVRGKTEELLENVMLVEWIIQYGNRYRASNERVHAQLQEAEESFRQFRYAKALEEAATAVEEVEPGAMKRIEELLQEKDDLTI
ncbi:septation ring formation regulator EzrA [Sporosarcina pasteurii]|uniref:Septation ring formation regulator EzrA n=1 Tax=Sporosarcina pasteurii TaxID=1474 RepID=A0A380C5F9_SPOPA|nr:septation ring formation regulator EzrA [Sporosarcina pasteurii]MDS9471762.1 septation ring formation regulator EzrA [Sporosarcina pasteurii]QBQ04641.1 septation ring formation regulator EzrA [Sporosarcina pasteurii]SUJ13208.1 Septation ring formation regulator EzrA [Sporosarcina pasteurii]